MFFCACVYLCVVGEERKRGGLIDICNIWLLLGNTGKFAISEQNAVHLISIGSVIRF